MAAFRRTISPAEARDGKPLLALCKQKSKCDEDFSVFSLVDQTDQLLAIGFELIAPTNVWPTHDGKAMSDGRQRHGCPTSTFHCKTNPYGQSGPTEDFSSNAGRTPFGRPVGVPYPTTYHPIFQSPMMPGR